MFFVLELFVLSLYPPDLLLLVPHRLGLNHAAESVGTGLLGASLLLDLVLLPDVLLHFIEASVSLSVGKSILNARINRLIRNQLRHAGSRRGPRRSAGLQGKEGCVALVLARHY